MPLYLEKALVGFAAGVMTAASVWSLLIPSIELSGDGAMAVVPAAVGFMFVVVEELLPMTAQGRHSNLGTIGFAAGFVLMMVLDVILG